MKANYLTCHAPDRTDQIHVTEDEQGATIRRTICGWQVRRYLPYVPIEEWGAEDQSWCPRCGIMVLRRLKKAEVEA